MLLGSDLSEKSQREQSRSGISVLNSILMLLLCVEQPGIFQTVWLGLPSCISLLILLCISKRTNNDPGLSVSSCITDAVNKSIKGIYHMMLIV